VRADLMTRWCATNPKETGHRGLSMLLAEKPRGTDRDLFRKRHERHRDRGARYRGMKEYEIAFDGSK